MAITEKLGLVEGLQRKVSHPRLTEPAPSTAELSECYAAAFRSPDHAWLRPWRFIECRGDERQRLGERLAAGLGHENPELADGARDKLVKGPFRAPLVIVCYAKVTQHPKVPSVEQQIATGCAINNFCSALYGLGYGSVWRTGDAAHSKQVQKQLGLAETDEIVGFIYVGTPVADDKELPQLSEQEFVTTLTKHLAGK